MRRARWPWARRDIRGTDGIGISGVVLVLALALAPALALIGVFESRRLKQDAVECDGAKGRDSRRRRRHVRRAHSPLGVFPWFCGHGSVGSGAAGSRRSERSRRNAPRRGTRFAQVCHPRRTGFTSFGFPPLVLILFAHPAAQSVDPSSGDGKSATNRRQECNSRSERTRFPFQRGSMLRLPREPTRSGIGQGQASHCAIRRPEEGRLLRPYGRERLSTRGRPTPNRGLRA